MKGVRPINIIMIGDGGHGKVVQELIRLNAKLELVAILDDQYKELKWTKDRIYKGPIDYAVEFAAHYRNARFIIAIGQNEIRKQLVSKLAIEGEQYITLVHPTAVISPNARIGRGTVVMANVVIQPDAHIGHHSLINTGAIIEHDCALADYVHVGPSATITGSVKIGEGAMIGAGATIIPGKRVEEWAVVGAGSTVITQIPAHSTAVGTPAKIKQRVSESR